MSNKVEMVEVEQLLEILTDYTSNGSFSSLRENVNVYNERNYAMWVMAKTLKSSNYDTDLRFTDEKGYEFLSKTKLFGGELLMPKTGGLGNAYIFPKLNIKATLADNVFLLKPNDKLDKGYFYQFLNSSTYREQLEMLMYGTSQQTIVKKEFKKIKVPLFEISEQKKIAEILTSVDKVIELTEIEIEKLKNLKKGMMQDLLTKGIGHTKFKDSPIGKIPESWETSIFKNYCKVRQGLQIAISNRHKEDGENRYKYITVRFIKDYANPEYIESPPASVICNKDDILMTRTGNTGQIVTNEHGVFHNNFFLIDFNRGKINKNFLYYYLSSELMQLKIEIAAGSTTIPDLNHGDFYKLPLVIPGKEEQAKIAEKLSTLDKLISNRNLKLEKIKNMKKGLMQDLLTGKVRVKV